MVKQISVILVLGILVLACNGSDRSKKPENLISKDQMVDLLYDLYVVNAAKGVNRSILEKNDFDPEYYILKKHGIDSAQFAESNTYYTFDTETYKEMVDEAKERLESEKKRYEAIKKREEDSVKNRRDSITKNRKFTKDSLDKKLDTPSFINAKPKDF
ncbi:DUF4296 domain-containing protein [Winogradskyella sp. PC D3.3]